MDGKMGILIIQQYGNTRLRLERRQIQSPGFPFLGNRIELAKINPRVNPPNQTINDQMEGVTDDTTPHPVAKWKNDFFRAFQYYLDRSTPHPLQRWLGTLVVVTIYVLRVYYLQGFYIVSYGLGIYILNLLIGFLSPKVDPELEVLEGASLPTRGSDEFKPFIRRLPEFKFWYAITKAFCVAFVMTFFSVFDVPVFWPILLCYWIVLFVLTMRRQIMHMIKYKYIPFSVGKQRYDGKKSGASSRGGLMRD